ncbi:flagellar export chaperone FliS [Pseudomonas sp. PSKL.D1]|uniref:flagellar export chaperone FliS n=1 Tax=Pseudomonas sp. PSKL.D1 TaxID=3029060 RepID=UPI00238175EB|nr:flagellar export chaperone FliS [Pseudomonas sp. PSKL.D1]WDY57906.1 flagellar export chaperone FliS [Pseudomonas sp. PSKL.D1]
MIPSKDITAYAKVALESSILAASPHQRITLLFEHYQAALRLARLHMQAGNTPEKGKAITRAINIVSRGLRGSLDLEQGGDIARQLDDLYDFVVRLLLRANLENNEESLNAAAELLGTIASAWIAIGPETEE